MFRSQWTFLVKVLVGFLLTLSSHGCKNSSESNSLTKQTNALYEGEYRPKGLGVLSEDATNQRMIECNERGYTWIAIIDGGNKPSRCGEKLATIDCSLDHIYKLYPELEQSLKSKIYDMPGYQLYNCGENENKLDLHFILMRSNKLYYKKLSLPSKS